MSSKPKIIKTDAEWRAQLTPMQYEVTRNQATERPFTGPWLSEKRAGLYRCVACGAPLFRSEAKYESGCGWPSFFVPADGEAIAEIEDFSHGMHRVEIRCAQCDAHIGHVFPDGPRPTGLRYCTNGTALDLAPDDAGGEKR
ncbi:MAG: peptide-methionine (R)-S-oxide reductase MsrB [Rhizobiales bacterium]|nr:peptide-methionine (R)-S-oxide reductase MsrB [Hyphomicrobiales bacterium]